MQHHQCSSAAIKLQRVNATEKPLLKAFLDAGRACGHSVSDMDRVTRDLSWPHIILLTDWLASAGVLT
jgi:hypothetical protein